MMNVKNIVATTSISATCTLTAKVLNDARFIFMHISYVVIGSATLALGVSALSKILRISVATPRTFITVSNFPF